MNPRDSRMEPETDPGLCNECNKAPTKSSESQRLSIQRCILSLLHACQCRNANCPLPSCQKMKRVAQHLKHCKRNTSGGCPVCRQFIALCYCHAKHCQENICLVPFCLTIKHKLRLRQQEQRIQQVQMIRRRIMALRAIGPRRSSKPSRACGPH
ncbi:histone lysine acetyltransferase CREBBP-like [Colossoma macropomum]|uniref:histone lysine acetyltransferase CREBBP-like n=1 Tax=Colossoma macropomum TaxID=42526 RepID=UPI0018646C7B|nr:histone lysine acetyltransferase CREBBP-like [Colossoma macropomum]